VTEKIFRKYLEIKSLEDFNEVKKLSENYSVDLVKPNDFQLNKFFYKRIGKDHYWKDRLIWNDFYWMDYISNENLSTYVLKVDNEIAGYFELMFNAASKESEIVYLGILEDYFGKKLGGFLLSEAIKISFSMGSTRVWVHTCSLDHKNALNNYLSRGMKIFKSEILIR
jgi:ribosomal protein S18 acetylase RimI-like enzyme